MYRVLLLSLFAISSASALALSDVNKQCLADNSEAWSNDNLIGTWYMIWKFTLFGGLVPSWDCPERNITRPTAAEIQQYKDMYNNPDQPYNIDDNPVAIEGANGLVNGLLMGHTIAKFYIMSTTYFPDPNQIATGGYSVDAYRPLTPKFIMYTQCALRGHTRWLLTSDRYATVAEMEEVIKNTPELNRLDGQRHCAGV